MKIYKNKVILGRVSVVVFILIIFGYSKIKEYNVLKDVFVFSKDNIVSIWRVKKDENKLRDDDSSNMEEVMQKFYIIDSKELVEFIGENT